MINDPTDLLLAFETFILKKPDLDMVLKIETTLKYFANKFTLN